MDTNRQKTSPILLKDILQFDSLRKQFPDKKIKLRFNTSWDDIPEKGEPVHRDYLEMYKNGDRFISDSILSQKCDATGKVTIKRLSSTDIVFQFIKVSNHRWLLIDAMNITVDEERSVYNKISKENFKVAGGIQLSEYTPFFGRLIVEWRDKPRQIIYTNQKLVDKMEVYEISAHAYRDRDDDFVGYEKVCMSYRELEYVIDNDDWKKALSAVYGVYVITDKKTGKLYVGSAYGDNGIYGRWRTYLDSGFDKDETETGEYPNKKLKELVQREGMEYLVENFQYAILEIFPKNFGNDRALQRESYWKKVLHTRSPYGYNDN